MIFPVIYLAATAFITIVPMIAKPTETGVGCLIIATGAPVYYVFCAWKSKPKFIQKFFCKYSFFFTYFFLVDVYEIPAVLIGPVRSHI